MKTLHLLRHAHSSPATASMADFDRPLDSIGREEATGIGRLMRTGNLSASLTLCSTARRTRETIDRVNAAAEIGRVIFLDTLYSGDAGNYLDAISKHPDEPSILVVGHNPMMDALGRLLTGTGASAARKRLASGFPTAGLAVLHFDEAFDRIQAGSGRLDSFLVPGDE